MTETMNPLFLRDLGLALPIVATPVAPAATDPADDPALWAVPERGGFLDGFSADVDDLFDVERRIDQGNAIIAEKRAARQPVPATWTIRLQSLTTKRLALRGGLAAKQPRALTALADLVARLHRQEAWFATSTDDPRFVEREDIFLATLAAYERLALAIDRVCDAVADVIADDPASVSWVAAWEQLRALGFVERPDVEAAIGGWDNDPREVVRRAKDARPRGPVPAPTATQHGFGFAAPIDAAKWTA